MTIINCNISMRGDFDINALTTGIITHIEKERHEIYLREQIKLCDVTHIEKLSGLVTELLKSENKEK